MSTQRERTVFPPLPVHFLRLQSQCSEAQVNGEQKRSYSGTQGYATPPTDREKTRRRVAAKASGVAFQIFGVQASHFAR
eukprot:91842-Amphidinium_carterae.2